MSSPWRPERQISVEEARVQVRELGLAGDEVQHVASGWDNTVIAVDHVWLFRFPRRRIALPGVERELEHLPRLAPSLPLPIPVPEHRGSCGEPPWTFWGARVLPGTELAVSEHADAEQVADAMGHFLRTLHSVPVDPALPVDPMRRSHAPDRAARAREMLSNLAESGLWDSDPAVEELLARAGSAAPPDSETVTSHGDLYARHVLVDTHGRASGVIDWGDLCAAPRSVDLAFVWSALLPQHRPTFWAAYGEIDEDTMLRGRTMAVFSLAAVASYAHDSRLEALLASSLRHLAAVAD
ncbi:phosphotransferase [Aeromicrobium sp. CF4.19]|uniref:phosphotransferase n=1 Tax=Aeromicrobium sp. CF4.19 TaxID=3373082 RepID=UPI003EE5F288